MQVACVLRQGPEFGAEHVARLADSILRHNDVDIVCLTDTDIHYSGVKEIQLEHSWPSWWAKLELFKHCTGPTLYLDLDTVVVGKLPEIGKRFTMLADVYRQGDFGSGVMSWQESPVHLYDQFKANPNAHIAKYVTRKNWGDQGFIRDHLGFIPDVFGDEYKSYKVWCRKKVPKGTKVVYFHGKPRPWQVNLDLSELAE